MSFDREAYRLVFSFAERVYQQVNDLELKATAQQIMLGVEEVIGQQRNGEKRRCLGLGSKPGEIIVR